MREYKRKCSRENRIEKKKNETENKTIIKGTRQEDKPETDNLKKIKKL